MTSTASEDYTDDLLRTHVLGPGSPCWACPTYQDTRNEASSPRGRIDLMRALEAGTLGEDDVREELSFCLGCRACEPVCPAGVRYDTLLKSIGRDAVSPGARAQAARPADGRRHAAPTARTMASVDAHGQLLGLHRITPLARTARSRALGPKVAARAGPGACGAPSAAGTANWLPCFSAASGA